MSNSGYLVTTKTRVALNATQFNILFPPLPKASGVQLIIIAKPLAVLYGY